jgi:hypothetical protein
MAALTLYGSSVADSTLATACDMALTTTGGTETSKQTVLTGSNVYGEVWSQGNAGLATVTAIPATPTGHGWVYKPGAGTFANATWGCVFTLAHVASSTSDVTIRFFKYTGTYSSIGTINVATNTAAKTTYTFSNTTMPSTTFGATDLLYIDLWYHDTNSNAGGDNPSVYISTSATVGVTSDMQVTTANFTVSAVTKDLSTRLRTTGTPVSKDLSVRLRLFVTPLYDMRTRLNLSPGTVQQKDLKTRLRLAAVHLLDLKTRLRVQITQIKDLSTRVRTSMGTTRNLSLRLGINLPGTPVKDLKARVRLTPSPLLNLRTRLRFLAVGQQNLSTRVTIQSLTGFFVPLITFTPSTPANPNPIFPEDVNANFTALNQATSYTGPVPHLVSDGGQLLSTAAGGLIVGGGKLGFTIFGDRFDVASTPGSLILGSGTISPVSGGGVTGKPQSGFSFQIGGTTTGAIDTHGFAGAGITADTTIVFDTGTLVKAVSFIGKGNGVYNHAMGFAPHFGYPIHTAPINQQCAIDQPTATTVRITQTVIASFICWLVEYS